jgi:hypothetical protein
MIMRILQGLAWLVVGGLVLQIYLAGAALFGSTTFQPHRSFGDALGAAILILLVVALIARPGRRVLGLAAALTALTIVQILLPSLRSGLPWVAALHAVNAVALVGVTLNLARAVSQAAATTRSPEAVVAAPGN